MASKKSKKKDKRVTYPIIVRAPKATLDKLRSMAKAASRNTGRRVGMTEIVRGWIDKATVSAKPKTKAKARKSTAKKPTKPNGLSPAHPLPSPVAEASAEA